MNLVSLKKISVEKPPEHGVIYLIFVQMDGSSYRYVGQSTNGRRRIESEHFSPSYRNKHPNFLYFLMERSESSFSLLPISAPDLKSGPIMNILEQWTAVVFRALLSHDLKVNMPSMSYHWIPSEEVDKGINIREPLAQGLAFNEWPMANNRFKNSPDSLKREWYQVARDKEITDRRESFLRGDIFDGSFWKALGWYGKADYEFQIWSVKFRVGRSWIDRFEDDGIRVKCELSPPGERHEHSVIRGLYGPRKYNDPAARLGIKISGVFRGAHIIKNGSMWVRMEGNGDKSIPRCNRLVDWLEDLDTEELRPRRWYPANKNLGRPYCGYTRHPLDTEDWKTFVKD